MGICEEFRLVRVTVWILRCGSTKVIVDEYSPSWATPPGWLSGLGSAFTPLLRGVDAVDSGSVAVTAGVKK